MGFFPPCFPKTAVNVNIVSLKCTTTTPCHAFIYDMLHGFVCLFSHLKD